jgi:hypothetical protein
VPIVGGTGLLPEIDAEFLTEKDFDCEIMQVPGEVRVILRGFTLPPHYMPRQTNLMVRLPAGYPNGNPDMFWTQPDVRLRNGAFPVGAEYHDPSAGGWQRWSRHDTGWRAGIDNLRTKYASVRRELDKGR